MKIFIICSKRFYGQISETQTKLERAGHILTLPNCYDDPTTEERYRALGPEEHTKWKSTMIDKNENTIRNNDAVLVLNFDKEGMKNYIGGATFLEMYDAYKLGKKVYLYNEVPEGILHDEIRGFDPIVINADLSKIL